jgi:hypothetical protein
MFPSANGTGPGDGEDQVHAERDHEELLTAKPVGEVTEEERTRASANQVPRACGRGLVS